MISPQRQAYQNWHAKLRRRLGPPEVCVDCQGPANHWALKDEYHVPGGLVYVEDVTAYESLCAGCHNRRDHTGIKYSEESKENMSAAQKVAHEARVASGAFQRALDVANSRKSCPDCGMVSTSAGLASHWKSSTHGRKDVD